MCWIWCLIWIWKSDPKPPTSILLPCLKVLTQNQIPDARRDRRNMEALAKSCTAKKATFFKAKPIASCKRLAKCLHVFGHTVRHTLGRKSSREHKTDGHGFPT